MTKQLRILVVDDDPDMLSTTGELLERDGHLPVFASNVESALQCLKNNQFDLILTDHWLQDGTGIEVALFVRQMKPNIPVFLMTGDVAGDILPAIRARADWAGIKHILLKPFQIRELQQAIAELTAKLS